MTPITIGLPSGNDRRPYHNEIASWLSTFSIGVYYPQCAITTGYNLAQQWDAEKAALNWTYAALAWAQEFEQPMVGYYPQYFWGDRKVNADGKINPNPNAYSFGGIDQDRLMVEELAYYLRRVREWLRAQGIAEPWYMVDEPAHPVEGDPGKHGWSPTVEARVVKFVSAARAAGWTVGVAYASYQAYRYWRPRLPEHRAILNAKHSRAEYGDLGGDVWLYNRQGSMAGLAEQMREFGASGYLHWSAEWDKLPLLAISGDDTFTPTEHWSQLLAELALYEMMDDEPMPTNDLYQLFLTNDATHFAGPDGLGAIPGWARRAELQIEFCRTQTNSSGQRFAPVGTPGAWLESQGVEVWYYVDPVAPALLATQTRVVPIGDHASDPFWFRKAQVNAILENGWLLKDKNGDDVIGGGRKRPVPDIGNMDYVEWLAAAIAETGVKRVFFDNFGPHQHGYHRPQKAAAQDGSDSLSIIGMRALCDRLRAVGVKIIANAAWEMSNPDVAPDLWVLPMVNYVDGVLIEMEYDPVTYPGQAPGSGFAKWGDGKWWALNETRLKQVIEHWRAAGKTVVLSATWRGAGGFDDYEAFAQHWHGIAQANGALFFTGNDNPPNKATHRVWRFPLPDTQEPEPEPEPDDTLALILAELRAGRIELAAMEADVLALRERLAVIEQLAVTL